jgi:uncharacterized protein (TIGR02145 family)
MNKDNIFRSSEFHMDTGDILHMTVNDSTGSVVQVGLYGNDPLIPEAINCSPHNIYTDVRDGTSYTKIVMGSQTWMKENFTYNYAGSILRDAKYGRLYTPAMMTNAGFVPAGWHVPTTAEWNTLISFCGSTANAYRMKSSSDLYWWPGLVGTNFGGMDVRGGGFDKSGWMSERVEAYFFCNTGAGEWVLFSDTAISSGNAYGGGQYISCRLIKD